MNARAKIAEPAPSFDFGAAPAPPAPAQPYCDDCGRKAGLPVTDYKAGIRVPGFYGKCPHCGITRACYGVDPNPPAPRRPRP
jgi:hypothetical protein